MQLRGESARLKGKERGRPMRTLLKKAYQLLWGALYFGTRLQLLGPQFSAPPTAAIW